MNTIELENYTLKNMKDGYLQELIGGLSPEFKYNEPAYQEQVNTTGLMSFLYYLDDRHKEANVPNNFVDAIKSICSEQSNPIIMQNTLETILTQIGFEKINKAGFKVDYIDLLKDFRENLKRNEDLYKKPITSIYDDGKSFYESATSKLDESDLLKL